MLKPDHIPDEVIEAAVGMSDRGGSMSDIIRTAINAWPGMYTAGNVAGSYAFLPLSTEDSDDA